MEVVIRSINGDREMSVKNNCIVKDLKREIEVIYGVSEEEQKLSFHDRNLDDNELLTSYGISSKSVIELHFDFGKFTVRVIFEDKTTHNVPVNKNNKILDLKKKIQHLSEMPIEKQLIVYRGQDINDDKKKLSDCGITENSVVNVVPKVMKECRQIIVRLDEGVFDRIDYDEEIKGSEIKQIMKEREGNDKIGHSFCYKGKILKDNDVFGKECGAFSSLTVQRIIDTSKSDIQINVISYDNRTHAFQLSKKDKCIELKKMIHNKIGLSVEEQLLTFHDISLDDDKSLEEYQMANNSVVNLMMRLKGG